MLEDLAIGGLCLTGGCVVPAQRPIDEEADEALVDARELGVELGALMRGDQCVEHARGMIEQRGPGPGDTLLADRQQHCGGARRRGDDARAHMHPVAAPALEGAHDVLGRRGHAAPRGHDDLDAQVKILLEVCVDSVDELLCTVPRDIAVEGHYEPVTAVLDCCRHFECLLRCLELPRRARPSSSGA